MSFLKACNLCYENKLNKTCSGRRGTKRKAEVEAEEKPSVAEKKDEEEAGNGQSGQRVVIEHWWVLLPHQYQQWEKYLDPSLKQKYLGDLTV